MVKSANKTFEEILNENQLVLLDTGIGNREISPWFKDYVYDSRSFSDINSEILSMVLDNLEMVYSIFSHPKAYTVPKVLNEIKNFTEIISKKFGALERCNSISRRKYNGLPIENWFLQEETRRIFYQIAIGYRQICDVASEKILSPQNSKMFNSLEKLVLQTTQKTKAKKNLKRGKWNRLKRIQDNHTDEQLVSMAMYLSTVDRTPVTIITSDADIARVTYRSCLAFKSQYRKFKAIGDLINENPIQVYHIGDEAYAYLKLDTSRINSNKK